MSASRYPRFLPQFRKSFVCLGGCDIGGWAGGFDDRADEAWKCDLGQSLTANHLGLVTAVSIGVYSVFHLPGRQCCDRSRQSKAGPSSFKGEAARTGRAAIFWSRIVVLTQRFLSQWEQIPHVSSKDLTCVFCY